MSKLVQTLREAIEKCGMHDGMTIGFHHHLRNGDYVINMTIRTLAEMGLKDIHIITSSFLENCKESIPYIEQGVITGLETTGIGVTIGHAMCRGILKNPALTRSHGGLQAMISTEKRHVDVAFIAASAADEEGNMNGIMGPNAFGSMGFAFELANHADKVIVITDYLADYPLNPVSIPETTVDYVVKVDAIGDPAGIESGIIRITKDPVGLKIAHYAVDVIQNSELFRNGFSFQTGGGSISLTSGMFLADVMEARGVTGSFIMGGISAFSVQMLERGCFRTLLDAQTLSRAGIESLRNNPNHQEVSGSRYASPFDKSCIVDNHLDVVVLGATEIDTSFNVNVHTDSDGYIMSGSGGNEDTACGSKLSIFVAPLLRARTPVITDKVLAISTPGKYVDVVITQHGIAVNTKYGKNKELEAALKRAGLPVVDIEWLQQLAVSIAGTPDRPQFGDRVIAEVRSRYDELQDVIYNVL